jgi:hypothetical protein
VTRKVNGQTYREWRDAYLATNGVTLPMNLSSKREMLFAACPHGFFPPVAGLQWQAFINMDRGADQRAGQVYIADATSGTVAVNAYVQLAFDEFREVCVRRAALAAVDIDAIREMAETWADAHQTAHLDVDAFMDDIKKAAGL